jgi:hypothetical protein
MSRSVFACRSVSDIVLRIPPGPMRQVALSNLTNRESRKLQNEISHHNRNVTNPADLLPVPSRGTVSRALSRDYNELTTPPKA